MPGAWSGNAPAYDEKADAQQQVSEALTEGRRTGKHIALVFGANWCPDCHALDVAMRQTDLAALLSKSFVVVKVDVGRMDKNVDLARKYGVPLRRGIPAMAVVDSSGKLLFAQDQGQFASARRMSFDSIKAFFEQWKPKS